MLQKMTDKDYFAHKALSSHSVISFYHPSRPFSSKRPLIIGKYLHAKILENQEVAAEIIAAECHDITEAEKYHTNCLIDAFAANTVTNAVMPVPVHAITLTKAEYVLPDTIGIQTEVVGMGQITNKHGRILPVKGKFDLINTDRKYVLDIKTTSNLQTFSDSIYTFGYYIQAAFYLRLANLATNSNDYKDFYWAVGDKKTKQTALVRCHEKLIKEGNDNIDLYLDNLPSYMQF